MGWMMDWGSNGSGFWALWMVLSALFWIALIALAVWAVLRLSQRRDRGPGDGGPLVESPRQILDRRFASGEIDAATYAEMRRVLEGRGVPGKSL